jgi:mono/diheme cytochrome c family protein
MRALWRVTVLVCAAVGAVVLLATAVGVVQVVRSGVSAQAPPTWLEATVARAIRDWSVPSALRRAGNPIEASADVLASGRRHFADHCASCHANDGSGDTPLGRGLFPRAPDMRAPGTQRLNDGQLFYFIEHGIRLTGMPAFGSGTPESERASWELVHFIRRLPSITDEEVEQMRQLNPRSPAEWRAEEEMREFLGLDPPDGDPEAGHVH